MLVGVLLISWLYLSICSISRGLSSGTKYVKNFPLRPLCMTLTESIAEVSDKTTDLLSGTSVLFTHFSEDFGSETA